MRTWVYNPHVGGTKPKPAVQERIRARILKHAAKNYQGRYDRIDVRFRGALCYVDAYVGGNPEPMNLFRLRYNGNEDRMSLAFFTYSHMKYEPTFYASGEDHGTPEEAFDIGAVYLN